MRQDLSWSAQAVLWPPATREALRSRVTFRRWILKVVIAVAMLAMVLFAGSFWMSFYAAAGGEALPIFIGMIVAALYYAALTTAFMLGIRPVD